MKKERKKYSLTSSRFNSLKRDKIAHGCSKLEDLFERGIDIESRMLYIGTAHFSESGEDLGVDARMAEYAIKGLHILNKLDKSRINILINTPGGNVSDGWAIYDAIMASSSPTSIEVYGEASSMGSIILQAGDARLMHPKSIVMVHDGYNQDVERMPARSHESWADWSKKERKRMYELFSMKSGKTISYWEHRCAHDFVIDAYETVREGLADRVIEYPNRLNFYNRRR